MSESQAQEEQQQQQSPPKYSSVNDYASQEALREALSSSCGSGCSNSNSNSSNLDWMLPSFDPHTTNVQSMQDELQRLQVLKSYHILDDSNNNNNNNNNKPEEQDFERITRIATRIFGVPIALVSLVDLGRQWFKSNRGLDPSTRETSRSLAFCAHAIQSKRDCFIVPDALQDFRFQNSPLVLSPPHIRFYAGAPLICPEGYKLGTLCIIDPKPRPNGLTEDEIETLKDLAIMVVKAMVDRRERLLEKHQDPSKLIAYTAHDLLTPLSAVQLSLSLLKDDPNIADALNAHQLEMISTASTSSDLMVRICQAAIQSLRQQRQQQQQQHQSSSPTLPSGGDNNDKKPFSIANLPELVQGLRTILEPIPMQVPVVLTLDPTTPKAVVSDDLKLFRSALNLLFHGIGRTAQGKVHLRIFSQTNNNNNNNEREEELVFECEDTSEADVPVEEQKLLSRRGVLVDEEDPEHEVDLGLSSMVSLVNSLHGTCGFRSRTMDLNQGESVGDHRGSIFWFRIPLEVAPEDYKDGSFLQSPAAKPTTYIPCLQHAVVSAGSRTGSCTSLVSLGSSCILQNPQHNDTGGENTVPSGTVSSPDTLEQHAYSIGAASRVGETNHPEESRERRKSWSESFTNALSTARVVTLPRKKRALIIEDSLVIRKTLERALSKLGFDVSQAENGLEGLEKLKETLFDFVLLDFLMPVMDGLDCSKQYRVWENENRPSFRQWIVGISAHVSVEASDQGLQAGMDGFYPKPITIKTLKEIHESKAVVARSKLLDELENAAGTIKPSSVKELVNGTEKSFYNHCGSDSTASADTCTTRSDNDVTHSADIDQEAAGSSSSSSAPVVCLIAVEASTAEPQHDFVACLSRNGWNCTVAHGGQDALSQLQTRNWDVVLMIDCHVSSSSSDLSSSAVTLIQQFRNWETKNRVNEQKNIFLVCDSNDIPDPRDPSSIVQPPTGFSGALRKSVALKDLEYMMNKSNNNRNSNGSSQHNLNIVVCQVVVLVNRERVARGVATMYRSAALDQLAREQAAHLAGNGQLEPSSRPDLVTRLQVDTVAENIMRDPSVRDIHINSMQKLPKHRKRILSSKYNEMGMGTAKSPVDGSLYLVSIQYFRYSPDVARKQTNQH